MIVFDFPFVDEGIISEDGNIHLIFFEGGDGKKWLKELTDLKKTGRASGHKSDTKSPDLNPTLNSPNE